jgi:oxygen-independent coproporphyrinogen-3 oxidase
LLPPLSLYVHLPWCVKKCPYCDFNSHARKDDLPEAEYLAALKRDLTADLSMAQGRELTSVFFGGGTPSLLSANFYQQLLGWLAERLVFAADIEITLEANPGTVEQERFKAYHDLGINRLSIGVQSFDDAKLTSLGRIHNGDQARQAMRAARQAGFDNVNLDLMYRLPEQSLAGALTDLETAISLEPEHLSWYELTLEPNTVFYSHPPVQPDDELLADMEEAGREKLVSAEYQRYEISAYSKSDMRCQHNLNYWEFGDYLAVGAGAHGKITFQDGRILRYQKTRLPGDYMAAINPTRSRRWLDADELPLEFALNALRLVEGVPESFFVTRTGLAVEKLDIIARPLRHKGLLAPSPRFACSETGLQFLNEVLAAF